MAGLRRSGSASSTRKSAGGPTSAKAPGWKDDSFRYVLKDRTTNLYLLETQFATCIRGDTLPSVYSLLVPQYKSHVYPNLVLKVNEWTDEYAKGVRAISQKRATNRITNYVMREELERASRKLESTDAATLRFGVKKEGHGYHGERGDFCLLGASISGKHLHLFYRSLELIGGIAYDLAIIEYLHHCLNRPWKSVTIHAAKANVFALKGNSNETLYPKFRKVLGI